MRRKRRRQPARPKGCGVRKWVLSLGAGWAATAVWYASGAADALVRLLRWILGG